MGSAPDRHRPQTQDTMIPSTASRPTFDTASLREANSRNIDLIERAAHLATETHKGQIRKGSPGAPYINHPARVALRLAQLGHRPEIIAAGFLHDVLEDTDTRRETIIETAGEEVARLVCACTQPPGLKFRERSAWTKARLLDAGDELRALIIADKEDNLACIADEIDRHGEQAWANLGTSRASQQQKFSLIATVVEENDGEPFDGFKKLVRQVFPDSNKPQHTPG